MKNLLLAALLGCFIASGLAQSSDRFEFTDSRGNCWVCSPSTPCQPCSSATPSVVFDRTCQAPNCDLPENRGTLFPNPLVLTQFLQCVLSGSAWIAQPMDCQCGTFFDYENQRCELPWMWGPYCNVLPNPIPDPIPCEITTEMPTTPAPTTLPQEVTTPPTTPAPCQCIPWIPCWCNNPCMNMPCGNCNGCQG